MKTNSNPLRLPLSCSDGAAVTAFTDSHTCHIRFPNGFIRRYLFSMTMQAIAGTFKGNEEITVERVGDRIRVIDGSVAIEAIPHPGSRHSLQITVVKDDESQAEWTFSSQAVGEILDLIQEVDEILTRRYPRSRLSSRPARAA